MKLIIKNIGLNNLHYHAKKPDECNRNQLLSSVQVSVFHFSLQKKINQFS